MGSFVLDFSAYNALSGGGNNGSYYGAEDAFAGGDPGMTGNGAGRRHHHHHHHSQNGPHGYHYHSLGLRSSVFDHNSVSRLDAEKALQDRRNQHIANFGATWLKPPGVPKTLYQIREELREQEEQAEVERREELAQRLVQAEAEAILEAEGAMEEMTAGEDDGDGIDGDPDGMGVDLDADMGEQDLDNGIPDADGEDFSFGNNNDDNDDDPFASSTEEDDEDDEGQDAEDSDEEDGDNDAPAEEHAAAARGRHSLGGQHQVDGPMTPGTQGRPRLNADDLRARAAERREMREIRATEDRVRAMLTQPRLSAMGLYEGEEELDEEDEAQMLQEDDLVRGDSAGVNRATRRQTARPARRSSGVAGSVRRRHGGSYGARSSLGEIASHELPGSGELEMDMDADMDAQMEAGMDADMEDMDADMDDIIPDGDMELSGLDGGYEHTDTEAELSSSDEGGGLDRGVSQDTGGVTQSNEDVPHHSFLAATAHRRMRGSLRSEHLDISGFLSQDGSSPATRRR